VQKLRYRVFAMQRPNPNMMQLGYAGLLPQAAALLTVLSGSDWQWGALALTWGYAGFIFSFLGGVWWGIGLTSDRAPGWVFGAAVLPALIALASLIPWLIGVSWPGPSLIILGALIAASPLVDRAIAITAALPDGWMQLRWHLSLGLGGMSIAIGLIS
jgi:Protein of unknown function (DUF3429)